MPSPATLGALFDLFRYLLGRTPDMNAVARVQYAPLYEPPTGIETLTPLDHALRYAHPLAQSKREAAMLETATNG